MDYFLSDRVQTLKPSAIREIFKYASDPEVISLSAGNPDPEAFPVKEIAEISNDVLTNRPIDALQYSITEGYVPLRNALKDYMKINSISAEILMSLLSLLVLNRLWTSLQNPL